jgi:RimJ/RimL family protein N-acetyltransferase
MTTSTPYGSFRLLFFHGNAQAAEPQVKSLFSLWKRVYYAEDYDLGASTLPHCESFVICFKEAFRFHRSLADPDSHIWPRTSDEVQRYIEDGCLFGAWCADTDELVGLVYVVPDGEVWELGGLTVVGSLNGLGIGGLLARLALAFTIAQVQPWENEQEIIAHVHEENESPRPLLDKLGFEFIEKIEVPADKAPPSMKRNAEGKIIGDTFKFTREGLDVLSRWFDAFTGTIARGAAAVEIDIDPYSLDNIKEALRDLVKKYPK